MEKYTVIFFIAFLMLSCSFRNEFGSRRNRFNLEKIKPNRDVEAFKIIDTTKIYKLIAISHRLEDWRMKRDFENSVNSNPRYLKFYGNGRVGEFTNIDFNEIETFDPKKADSHLYRFKNKELIVQQYFTSPQCGQCFVKDKVQKRPKGEIALFGDDYTYIYKAIDIPKSFLIYKPDW